MGVKGFNNNLTNSVVGSNFLNSITQYVLFQLF